MSDKAKLSKWARFALDLVDADSDEPAGFEVASFLHRTLEQANQHPGAIENWRDSGWSFSCKLNGKKVIVIVSKLPTGTNEWVLCVDADAGVFASLFNKYPASEVKRIAECLHEAMSDSSVYKFGQLRWHPDGWRGLDDVRTASDPSVE